MWYINLDRSFFRFVTIHACDGRTDRQTDRQMDRQTEFSSLDRVCIPCSAVKTSVSGHDTEHVSKITGIGMKTKIYTKYMKYRISYGLPHQLLAS